MGVVERLMLSPSVWTPGELGGFRGPLLLDTHIWIWLLEGNDERMAAETVGLLDRSGQSGGLRVADISAWEVAVKAAKGKLTFSVDPLVWLSRAERAPGTRALALDRQILIASARLGDAMHGDPVDRMLIAAAQLNNLPLVTVDELIIEYAKNHPGTPVVDARPARGRKRARARNPMRNN